MTLSISTQIVFHTKFLLRISTAEQWAWRVNGLLSISLHVYLVVPLGLCSFLSLEIWHSWVNLDWVPVSYKNSVSVLPAAHGVYTRVSVPAVNGYVSLLSPPARWSLLGKTGIPCDAFSLYFFHLSSNLSLFYPDMVKCLFFSRMIAMQLLPRGSPLCRKQRLVSILRSALLSLSGLGEKFI